MVAQLRTEGGGGETKVIRPSIITALAYCRKAMIRSVNTDTNRQFNTSLGA